MAFLDYGAILKVNGELKNINQSMFMDMKEAVGFEIESIPYQYEWEGKTYDAEDRINGNYFVYFGDEDVLFCVYKNVLRVIVNKKETHHIAFTYELGYKQVIEQRINEDVVVRVKRICGSDKLHLKVQYKGVNYEVVYGYGIDNNINTYKRITLKEKGRYDYNLHKRVCIQRIGSYQYGYNAAIKRYMNKFLNIK